MRCPNSDRTPPNLSAALRRLQRDRFESHDAEVRKSRRRQPALSAGSQHDGRDHGRDRKPHRVGIRGSGSLGDAGFGSAGSTGKPTVVEVRNWMPGKAALIKRAAAELLFTASHIRRAADEAAARRRGADGDRALHAALCGRRRRPIEAGQVGADHARSLSRRSRHGRAAEAGIGRGESHARAQCADVPRAQCRRHHRTRHRKTAVALSAE